MQKKLIINSINADNIRLDVKIHLNEMILTIEKKYKNLEYRFEYQKKYKIDSNIDIDKLIYKFYEKYIELKSTELYWEDKLNEMSIIEIDLDIED